jgi:hypothetical protein
VAAVDDEAGVPWWWQRSRATVVGATDGVHVGNRMEIQRDKLTMV